jgi:hypothetical protein
MFSKSLILGFVASHRIRRDVPCTGNIDPLTVGININIRKLPYYKDNKKY